ncbi:MAG: hypothetical protein QW128_06320 [Thermoprotei archaeon]
MVCLVNPDRGKAKTIKNWAVYVYLPSLEIVEWKWWTEKAGVSISKFVVGCKEIQY